MPHEMTVITLKQVRERENSDATFAGAQARADEATRRIKQHYPRMEALAGQAAREGNVIRKIHIMRELVQYVVDSIGVVSGCSRQACSHCCNIPVLLTRIEAGVIAHENRIAITNPKKYNLEANDAYTGTPCPFLRDGSCSIYATRPLVCRLHYTMDADDLLCHLFPGESIRVPYFNQLDYHMIEVVALGVAQVRKVADIREFFPRQQKR